MRVLVVGEGNHEHKALPRLVQRMAGTPSLPDFDKLKHGRRVHGKSPDGRASRLYKRAVGWMLDAQRKEYEAVILLIDEDGKDDRRAGMDLAQESKEAQLPRACGVAVRSFDAWFLADETALSNALGETVNRQPDPETVKAPKADCEALLSRTQTHDGLGDFYAALAESMNLDTVQKRCPKGFAPFADRVRKLRPIER